jgi:hypothetical protein
MYEIQSDKYLAGFSGYSVWYTSPIDGYRAHMGSFFPTEGDAQAYITDLGTAS